MQQQSPDRLEIFLALALRTGAEPSSTIAAFMPTANESENAVLNAADESFSVIRSYLTARESERFERLRSKFQSKSEAEKTAWQAEILSKIGADEHLIDDSVHWSYIGAALRKEIPAVRKIIFNSLSPEHQKAINAKSEKALEVDLSKATALEKTVRRAFAAQFVRLNDLPKPTAFDRLNGAQLARLIRLTGIHEVALACQQIEAVESVAAFLRLFSAEDAQAIASQLNGMPKKSEARFIFAENLVQKTMEIESNPSAMLDLLGIRLAGILFCDCPKERVIYTNQKLPLEVAPQLPKIIEKQCRRVPPTLQIEINAEIERVAQTIYRRADGK